MNPFAVSAKESTALVVRETISAILPNLPAHAVPGNKSLKDIGADSVDRVEILLMLMDRLGIREPLSTFSNIPTIDDLIDYLHGAQRI